MKLLSSFAREINFLKHSRAVVVALICAFFLSSIAILGGLLEYDRQQESLEKIKAADHQDRASVLEEQTDWGGAAYYSFHLTYDEPDTFAIVAMGQRDTHPWKHRIRMLALEGQIYERDNNNPIIAIIGRFDFSFFAAFVLPFIIIVLIHDLRSSEKRDGRYYLLLANAGPASGLWVVRTLVISLSLYVCVVLPMIIGSVINDVDGIVILKAAFYLAAYMAFWALVSYWFASWHKSSTAILASLIACWVLLAVITPTASRVAIDKWVAVPSGAEILMQQRETVNGAWDLPKEDTMSAFLLHHPEWIEFATINRPFEWKWYFAFQQVGDIKTEALSKSYREGRLKRDQLAGYFSLISPPALFERSLQKLAKTDTKLNLAYEEKVRNYHAQLREFYYPKLFKNLPFEKSELNELPEFKSF